MANTNLDESCQLIFLVKHLLSSWNISVFFLLRPPLRQFLMDGDFFIGAALSTTLTKLALRYVAQTPDPKKQNVSLQQR